MNRVTVSVGGGTPVEATRKEVEAAFQSTASQPGLSVSVARLSGEMTFTDSDGKYDIVCKLSDGIFCVPYPVTLKDSLDIVRIFAKLGMLHEGHTWRERE